MATSYLQAYLDELADNEQVQRFGAMGEAGLNMLSGFGSEIAGLGAGLLGRATGMPGGWQSANDLRERVAGAGTYQPRLQQTQAAMQDVGQALAPVAGPIAQGWQQNVTAPLQASMGPAEGAGLSSMLGAAALSAADLTPVRGSRVAKLTRGDFETPADLENYAAELTQRLDALEAERMNLPDPEEVNWPGPDADRAMQLDREIADVADEHQSLPMSMEPKIGSPAPMSALDPEPAGISGPYSTAAERGSKLLEEPDGGFTFTARGTQPKSGFSVAAVPGENTYIAGNATPGQVQDFMRANEARRRAVPNTMYGGWQNPDLNRSELELTNVLPSQGEALTLAEATGRRGAQDIALGGGGQDSIFDLGSFNNIKLQQPKAVGLAQDVLEGRMNLGDVPKASQNKVLGLLRLQEELASPAGRAELDQLYDVGNTIAQRTYPAGVDRWWQWDPLTEGILTPEQLKLRSHTAGWTSPGVSPLANITHANRLAHQMEQGLPLQAGLRPAQSRPSAEKYMAGSYYDPMSPKTGNRLLGEMPMARNPKTGSMALALQEYPDVGVYDTLRWGRLGSLQRSGIAPDPETGLVRPDRDVSWVMRDATMNQAQDLGVDAGELTARQWLGLTPDVDDIFQLPWASYSQGWAQKIADLSPRKFKERTGVDKPPGADAEAVIRMHAKGQFGKADPKLLAAIAAGGAGLLNALSGDDEAEADNIPVPDKFQRSRMIDDYVDQAQTGR
jgi:hypothetical protein